MLFSEGRVRHEAGAAMRRHRLDDGGAEASLCSRVASSIIAAYWILPSPFRMTVPSLLSMGLLGSSAQRLSPF